MILDIRREQVRRGCQRGNIRRRCRVKEEGDQTGNGRKEKKEILISWGLNMQEGASEQDRVNRSNVNRLNQGK